MARKMMLFMIAMLLLIPLAAQAETTATFGDQNSSNEYRMKATYDGTSGVITFAPDTGIVYPYERYTASNTNNTLIAAESGKTIVDTGGGGTFTYGSKHILPRAAPGLTYTLCSGARGSNGITIDIDTVDTDDTIEVSISGTSLDGGDSLKNNGQAGECITVFSTVANKWTAIMSPAAWVDNGTN